METHYTWAGIVAIFIIICVIVQNRFKIGYIFSNPAFIISFSFFNFFGKYKYTDFTPENNLILVISFVLFFCSYLLFKNTKLNSFDRTIIKASNGVILNPVFFIKRKNLIYLIFITILYVIFDIYLNSIIYGSLQRALLRFYSIQMVDSSYGTIKNLLSFLYKLVLGILFIFRFYGDVFKKNSNIVIICAIILSIIAIPRGSRGAVVSPFVTLIIADLLANRFYHASLKKHIIQYATFFCIGISCFLILTVVRSTKFNSFEDLISIVESTSLQQGADEFAEREGELMIADTKLCFETFGSKVEFLSPFYTIHSIGISFIPRVLYPTKPVSFGLFINAIKERNFSGLKEPSSLYYPGATDWAAGVAGEGWANGGIIGIFLYSVIFGFIAGKSARYYYILIVKRNGIALLLALLFFSTTNCFIRGGLQSTLTPVLYTIIIVLILLKIYKYYARIRCCRCLGEHKR